MLDRSVIKERVMTTINNHIGKSNAISAPNLYLEVFGYPLPAERLHNDTRILRSVVQQLRQKDQQPIISSSVGYWLAENQDEYVDYLTKIMNQAARRLGVNKELSKVVFQRIAQQSNFDFKEEQEDVKTH